nr:cytochrome b [Degeeriella rufa]
MQNCPLSMGKWHVKCLLEIDIFSQVKKAVGVPVPASINYMWNFGSLLGMNLAIQLITGLVLALNYEASAVASFESVIHICQDVQGGWFVRYIHANGASFFFVMMYLHIARSMYFGGYKNKHTWLLGVSILLMSMGAAFLGYVLPWGQMSLWGATVITNLLSAVPYVGLDLTIWLWGGFSVGSPTLTRFFSFHFILPFVILMMVGMHLLALHDKGSSNPLGVSEQADKVAFHPYFTYKDAVGFVVFVCMFMSLVLIYPDVFMDPDNFLEANPLVTPPHIQPEWYFLFAYAVLRSIPSKLGGVVGLAMSVGILYLCVLKGPHCARFSLCEKLAVISLFVLFIMLTWVGMMPAEYPMVEFGKLTSTLYFIVMFVWLSM